MADSPLASLTAATPATGGLLYGTQSAADRKFTLTAAGATLAEAADAAAQRTALGVLALTGGTLTGALGITGGTVTDSTPLVAITQTWNDGTEAMRAITVDITDTASAEFSSWFRATRGGTQFMSLCKKTAWGISNMPTLEGDGGGAGQVCFNSPHGTVILARKDTGWGWIVGSNVAFGASGTKLGWSSNAASGNVLTTPDTFFMRAAAASIQMGENHATTATNQTLKAHDVTAGTGADLILSGGTGSAANGSVRFGTHSAIGVETVTGYITIKDAGGTVRKLAVVS